MKVYIAGVKQWQLIFLVIGLGLTMSFGALIIILLAIDSHFGYLFYFIAYLFLLPISGIIVDKEIGRNENYMPPRPPPLLPQEHENKNLRRAVRDENCK